MGEERGHFSSRLGFILAASGSAVGLGNIWRFPYITAENGGGIFVLIYIVFVATVGLSVMLVELTIGRHAESNPVGALRKVAPGALSSLGYLFVFTGIAILSYYGVVAGWTVGYLVKSVFGELDADSFGGFIQNPTLQISYLAFFILITTGVVYFGVKEGIEKMSTILMPILLLLLIALIARGLFLPTAAEGLKFYLVPDFDKVSVKTFLYAVGQAFFSLSLGMGAMITYGSYIEKKENLLTCASSVVFFDTLVAFLAGLLIFPVVGGVIEKGGPTLVFVTLIKIFHDMPGGQIIAIVFFLLLAIAALTSTVSLHEVATAYLVDERKLNRHIAVWLVGGITLLLGIPSALSLGAVKWLSGLLGKGFLGIMDFVFGNIALTFGAMMLCIIAAYKWRLKNAVKEIEIGFPNFGKYKNIWGFFVSYISPLAIALMLIYVLITGEGLG
ncbi:MAG: sodium-dependent transporter [Myxococcota bacterium]